MLVTDCQLVAILPWDMWSRKGILAIQAQASNPKLHSCNTNTTNVTLPLCKVRKESLPAASPKTFQKAGHT